MVWAVSRAPYASDPEKSRGRLHPEPEHAMRSPFQRDRDRILHSSAFRRLKHKTQVFVYHEGDHYRTRLTHSLEVAQIARTIARVLGLDEDLAEALALAHDLGHTPFGHAGEEALNAEMARYGGFSHNDQTLRILTRLEHGYAEFDGLNLTWEALEGTAKHNGPLLGAGIEKPVPPSIAEYDRKHRQDRGNRMTSNARRVVSELFRLCLAEPDHLPVEWRALIGGGEAERARVVADYLAGMTDRFALHEHRRLVDT